MRPADDSLLARCCEQRGGAVITYPGLLWRAQIVAKRFNNLSRPEPGPPTDGPLGR